MIFNDVANTIDVMENKFHSQILQTLIN